MPICGLFVYADLESGQERQRRARHIPSASLRGNEVAEAVPMPRLPRPKSDGVGYRRRVNPALDVA